MELMKDIGLLTEYGIAKGLIEPEDRNYTINRLLEVFGLSTYDPTPAPAQGSEAERSDAQANCPEARPAPPVLQTGEGGSAATTPAASAPAGPDLAGLLDRLCDEAYKRGLIPENSVTFRDLFDTRLMGILTPRPSLVQKQFRRLYVQSPKCATDGFYRFCRDTNYIRTDRIARDLKWRKSILRLTCLNLKRIPVPSRRRAAESRERTGSRASRPARSQVVRILRPTGSRTA